MLWLIPITITEYGRSAVINANSKAEAIAKLRRCDWVELTDAARIDVTKVGPAVVLEQLKK